MSIDRTWGGKCVRESLQDEVERKSGKSLEIVPAVAVTVSFALVLKCFSSTHYYSFSASLTFGSFPKARETCPVSIN